MLRSIVLSQIVITALFTAVVYTFNASHLIPSVVLGGVLATLNFLSLVWVWQRIFVKKSIALAGGVIVFKYAILIGLLFLMVSVYKADILGILIGLGTMVPCVLIFALKNPNDLMKVG